MKLTPQDIDIVCGLVYDLCGIYLDESKGYLIESRLGELAERANCSSYTELARKARYNNDRQLQDEIVDAITTNETLFFRDNSPYQALQHKIIPEIIDSKENSMFSKRLRIWSAACSTGQEPYSIAMTLFNLIPDILSWDVMIYATDISDEAIRKASIGRYAEHEIARGMPPAMLSRFFHAEGKKWRVNDELRSLISFERRNLLEPFVGVGTFDIVLCRNVAIYFTPETRSDVFHRLCETLPETGYLLVGSSESLTDLGPRFVPQTHCRAAIYRPNQPLEVTS